MHISLINSSFRYVPDSWGKQRTHKRHAIAYCKCHKDMWRPLKRCIPSLAPTQRHWRMLFSHSSGVAERDRPVSWCINMPVQTAQKQSKRTKTKLSVEMISHNVTNSIEDMLIANLREIHNKLWLWREWASGDEIKKKEEKKEHKLANSMCVTNNQPFLCCSVHRCIYLRI